MLCCFLANISKNLSSLNLSTLSPNIQSVSLSQPSQGFINDLKGGARLGRVFKDVFIKDLQLQEFNLGFLSFFFC
jgi:hypothetical protein